MYPTSYYVLFALPGHVPVSTLSGVSGTSLIYFIFIFIYLLTLFFCKVFVSFLPYILLYTISYQSSLDMSPVHCLYIFFLFLFIY